MWACGRNLTEWIANLPTGSWDDLVQNVHQYLAWKSNRVNSCDHCLVIEVEHRAGLLVIHLHAAADDFFIGIIGSAGMNGPPLDAFDERLDVGAGQVDDSEDVNMLINHGCLARTSRDAIEHKKVVVGSVLIRVDEPLHVLPPEPNCQAVRYEKTLS